MTIRSISYAVASAFALMVSGACAGTAAAPASAPVAAPPVISMGRVSSQDGWAVTSHRVAWTSDGGTTWSSVGPAGVAVADVLAVQFDSAADGWIVQRSTQDAEPPGATTIVMHRTMNGGRSWSRSMIGKTTYGAPGATMLSVIDQANMWILVKLESSANFSRGDLFVTNDGGSTWRRTEAPIGDGLVPLSANAALVIGGATGRNAVSTLDGGSTWEASTIRQYVTGEQDWFAAARQLGAGRAVVATASSVGRRTRVSMHLTGDAGSTWSSASSFDLPDEVVPGVRIALSTLDGRQWFVVGPRGTTVIATTDSGNTWSSVPSSGLPPGVLDVAFESSTDGWALFANGTCASGKTNCSVERGLLRTSDGGKSWTRLAP